MCIIASAVLRVMEARETLESVLLEHMHAMRANNLRLRPVVRLRTGSAILCSSFTLSHRLD